MNNLDKDLALLASLSLAFVEQNKENSISDEFLDDLYEIVNASDWVFDLYKDSDSEVKVLKDIIQAVHNLQIAVEEYQALEREDS